MDEPVIRPAEDRDLGRITDIYNHYIETTHVSFDVAPWSLDERRKWFETRRQGSYPVLVATQDDRVVGAAWSGPFRPKRAYDGSAEATVMLEPDAKGRGVGTRLLAELLDALAQGPFHRAYAVIALPNEVSVALHKSLGFRSIGVQHEVGTKFGKRWSTEWFEYRLDSHGATD